ncbi:MAG: Ig-like domain-containing protein, partial [Gemmatimonadaceae bacterium]
MVDSILITAPTTSMQVGQTQRLVATARDASGNALSSVAVTWSSSAFAVAGVDGSGEVTANGPGQAVVRANAGGKADSVTITVQAAPGASQILPILGLGAVTDRYTAEVNVTASGTFAYTSTWGILGSNTGNAVKVWNVSGATPVLADSVILTGATTLGDLQVSDDGALLVVATERANGSIVILSLADPARPVQISRFTSPSTTNGVHTAEVARVNGRLYAFLSIDPGSGAPARLTIVDISDPANPVQVFSQEMGNPFVHDVFVRDGL